MFFAILILLVMSFIDLFRFKDIQFKSLSKTTFFVFINNFLILMQLNAKHVEFSFIEFEQIFTILYFAHFLIIVSFLNLLENNLIELTIKENEIVYFQFSLVRKVIFNYIVYCHFSLNKLNVIIYIIISFFINNSSNSYEYCDAFKS